MVAPGITGRTRPTKFKKQASQQKRKRDDVDVEKLEQAVTELVRRLDAMRMDRFCIPPRLTHA
jgi:KaiC/GvpD/RAD55 family RecA-like ATPase